MPWLVLLVSIYLLFPCAAVRCEPSASTPADRISIERVVSPETDIGIDELAMGRHDESFASIDIASGGGFRLYVPAGVSNTWLRGRAGSNSGSTEDPVLLMGCVRGQAELTVYLPDGTAIGQSGYPRVARRPFDVSDFFGMSPGTPSADWIGAFGTVGTPGSIGPIVALPIAVAGVAPASSILLRIETSGTRGAFIDFLVLERSWLTRYMVTRRGLVWGYAGIVVLLIGVWAYLFPWDEKNGTDTKNRRIPPAVGILGGYVSVVLLHRFVQYLLVPLAGRDFAVLQTGLRWSQSLLFLYLAIEVVTRTGEEQEEMHGHHLGLAGTILVIMTAIPNIILEPLRSLTYVDDIVVIGLIVTIILSLSVHEIRRGNASGWFTAAAAGIVVGTSLIWGVLRTEPSPGKVIAMSVLPLAGDLSLLMVLSVPILRGRQSLRSLLRRGRDADRSLGERFVESSRPNADSPVLLIVDDIPVNRRIIVHYCTQLGMSVDEADSATAAITACRGMKYDLILMDLGLPDFDGIEAVRRIRASGGPNAKTPVIGITAGGSFDSLHPGGGVGLSEYIYKPIREEDLKGLIDRWCRGDFLPD